MLPSEAIIELADSKNYHFTVTTRVLHFIHIAGAVKAGDEKCNFIHDQKSLEIYTLATRIEKRL